MSEVGSWVLPLSLGTGVVSLARVSMGWNELGRYFLSSICLLGVSSR